MADNSPTANSIQVYVLLSHGGGQLRYGYRTRRKIYTALNNDLGIEKAENETGVIYGINSPKPYKVTKISTSGGYSTISSFASDSKAKKLQNKDEFIVTPPKIASRGISSAANVKTVYVELPSITAGQTLKYAWNMRASLFNDANAAVTTNLGIEAVTANDIPSLIWGANNPKPPRASKRIGGRVRETFITPKLTIIEKAQAAGWNVQLGSWDAINDKA